MKILIDKFNQNLKSLGITPQSKLLLALSGGIDSMVLAMFLLECKLNFSVAHANFQLRAEESDKDEAFVINFSKQHNLTYYIKKFKTKEFKESGNYSIQMAARKLRYDWFNELMNAHKFDYLLTAHHLNDSLETFLINLSRGTGIEGLSGIKSNHAFIKRPLFNFTKKEIEHYAHSDNLSWREDASNAGLDYVRNKIRHHISPFLEDLHPQFLSNFEHTIQNLTSDYRLIQNHIGQLKTTLFQAKADRISISINELKQLNPAHAYYFHLFEEYGFKHPLEVEKLIHSKNNGEIQSSTHRMIKNREELLITQLSTEENTEVILSNPNQIIEKPLYLKLSKSNRKDELASESLDLDRLKFPLRLRKAQTGDVFHPLGMKGSKKVSKFFKDEKYSKLEKETTWILEDADRRILSILGKRIDERFKITTHTVHILNIYLC